MLYTNSYFVSQMIKVNERRDLSYATTQMDLASQIYQNTLSVVPKPLFPQQPSGHHTCPHCNYGSNYLSALKRHIMFKHTREKPFKCNFCEKRFTMKDDLTKHIRIHTGEKPYQCPVCLKRFTQKGTLNTHMDVHPGYCLQR